MMEKEQLISVVIPMYNAEKYIEETIKSILNQTYQHIEIVIVDDESTDQSSSIVKQLKEKSPEKIQYVKQKNQGVSVARNTGIENANGQYIAFLDSDDLWHPTKLEKQIQSMHFNKMDACYCGYMNFFETTPEKSKVKTKFIKGNIASDYLTRNIIAQTSTWVFKKSVVKDYNIRFTPNCNWGEDLEFLFKLISVTEVCYVDEYLTYYRILQNGNLTSKYQDYKLLTTTELEVYRRIKGWLQINSVCLIEKNPKSLIQIIDTYLFPSTIINSSYMFMNYNDQLKKDLVKIIKSDLKKYCQKIYLKNGRKSLKLYTKLWLLRFKILFS
ncbi:glycosyltransferase family 2 protein [Bacillus wiedmannii]|uniref:glycosyltransferase family 2 protein n=1 Tax=Bacillus wiedmannii TaxID=1890302 RepID=UPI000992F8B2|nr:glycosyltransferase family A protein [Bacillus wiedmannii]MED2790596.1 glycosyltransferase family A protein [Bacillus wiedmannii]MED3316242.1 glycosyltransferase family A protein [Bacillus wiedmannii]OOR24099.1 beta-1,3-N-acetylglucosaminyltransferase [Bacillus wiedmannii]PGB62580.1 glycosyltransferase family 2 protein [Bacillus wiedmannii]PGD56087.1 glycosyltransferase family 2 protein [Bacillus wiedmannii]